MTDLNQLIQMKPRWHTGEALCATTVSSIYVNIYHGFTVVTLTAPWYWVRNVGIHIEY